MLGTRGFRERWSLFTTYYMTGCQLFKLSNVRLSCHSNYQVFGCQELYCIYISLKTLITFTTSQSLPSNVFISSWILYFLLLYFYWGTPIGNVWFQYDIFLHIVCWSFLNIKCQCIQYRAYSFWLHIAYNYCGHFPTLKWMVWWNVVCK